MRVIIKNADFSDVSIGKVVKDLSFSFTAADGVDAINAFFPNYNSGTPTSTTIYVGSSGGSVTTSSSANRSVSDYIPVIAGMTIKLNFVASAATTPVLIAFNSNKEVISSSCVWETTNNPVTYTVPEGVAFIKVQVQTVVTGTNNTAASGTMPV